MTTDKKAIPATFLKFGLAFAILAACIAGIGISAFGGSGPIYAMLGALIGLIVVCVAILRKGREA
ncbi:hypothetical protein [Streptomyces sp. NPDC091268]|uniref:hypothetical protein n=1 Tax=Streptomyces sp. NPDC091268 TaxID=3365979 RepID=UPI0038054DFF